MIKQYAKYLKHNPQGYWFKAKLYGWGWVPVSWQGWLIIFAYIGVIVFPSIFLGEDIKNSEQFLMLFLPLTICSTLILLWICYKKGEKPHWSWGEKPKVVSKK